MRQLRDDFRKLKAANTGYLLAFGLGDFFESRYDRPFAKERVFSVAEGVKKLWKMKRLMLSKRAATNWNELLVVR